MIEYNSQKRQLVLPEYGRSVQQMVDHCLTIEDRTERTRCANSIINIMGNLFPYLRDIDDFKHKLWDHLAIMSDYKLEIDYPYEVIAKENLNTPPAPIAYSDQHIKLKHYGRYIEDMIVKAMTMEEGEERAQFIVLIANQMKKQLLVWNKEAASDIKVYDDLRTYSRGRIDVNENELKLVSSKFLLLGEKPQRNNNSNNNNKGKNQKQRAKQ